MRPTPEEIIAGVRRLLKDVVEPELTSDHARARLAETRAVLAQVSWNDAGFLLADRNRGLASALATASEWVDGDLSLPARDSFAAHQDAWERLARAAEAALVRIADRLREAPDDGEAVRARSAILSALV